MLSVVLWFHLTLVLVGIRIEKNERKEVIAVPDEEEIREKNRIAEAKYGKRFDELPSLQKETTLDVYLAQRDQSK